MQADCGGGRVSVRDLPVRASNGVSRCGLARSRYFFCRAVVSGRTRRDQAHDRKGDHPTKSEGVTPVTLP
jgi:hypothetical protein